MMLRYKLSKKRRSINIKENATTVVKKLEEPKDMGLRLKPRVMPSPPSMSVPRSITPPSNLFNNNKKRKFQHDDDDDSSSNNTKSFVLSVLEAASDIAASTPPSKSTTAPSSNNNVRKGTRPSPWRKAMIHRRDNDNSDDIDDTLIIQPRRLSFSSCSTINDGDKNTTSSKDEDTFKTTVDDDINSNIVCVDDSSSDISDKEDDGIKEVTTRPAAVSPTPTTTTVYDSEEESTIKPAVVSPFPSTTMISDSEDEPIIKSRRVSFYDDDIKEVEDKPVSSSSKDSDTSNESIAANVLIGLKNNEVFTDNIIEKSTIIVEPPQKKQRRVGKSKIDNTVIHGGMQFHHEKDPENVNSLHCFVREELLEVFVVGNPDKNGDIDGGQVGIRCKFCAGSKSRGPAAKGAGTMRHFFPPNVETIYQRTCTWQRLHFPFCSDIPKHLAEKYHHYKATDKTRGRKAHWAKSAKSQGMRNSVEPKFGVFYHADKVEKSSTTN